ncbi:hypothetical protein EV663_11630 [Rhodovulum bhavnagarense]|uniref:50S ribosomal protein L35 n=1 Tax=Rhodovulum bhavnagarense TaxID=992286 RepID=A0A4R2RKI4_9RHOB|nr:hypothetical protein [Rhodovulum bhavnagarense]TCP59735.1 hypothetical protein EV663_11630 [Rhodovulum bhavnagarense]
MEADIYLVVGVIAGVLAIPSLLSAFSEDRAPRAAAVLVLIAAGTILVATMKKPGGYRIADIPEAFTRVASLILN